MEVGAQISVSADFAIEARARRRSKSRVVESVGAEGRHAGSVLDERQEQPASASPPLG